MPSAIKAIGLFSGGLDSYLAAFLIKEQGIEVEAVKFLTVFTQAEPVGSDPGRQEASILAKRGINLCVVPLGQKFIDLVVRPTHGRGRNMNPCLDCRILMLKEARERMRQAGGTFVFTGEVLGQRPFSQNIRALKQVELESGLSGLLLRPLSARLLPVTEPEREGQVDRERLLAIQGRGRKEQFELARRYGLTDPPTPAGGCLLTDPAYSGRLRSVLSDRGFLTEHAARIIRHGRYFRLSRECFLVVGRNQRENFQLLSLLKPGEWLLEPGNCVGPVGIGIGRLERRELDKAAKILARYSDCPPGGAVKVVVRRGPDGKSESLMVLQEGLI